MPKTDFAADRVLAALVGGVPMPAPPNVYVGLLLAVPEPGGPAVEPVGNGYARVAVAASATAWTAPATVDGKRERGNAAPIAFPAPTGPGWGTAVYAAAFDAATGGNRLIDAALEAPRELVAGDPVTLEAGALRFRER